jgi:hypothetical protein
MPEGLMLPARESTWHAFGHWLAARNPLRPALDVAIEDCVHFCGFRYGRGEYNAYETYLIELSRGSSVTSARRRFVDFLRHYRPRHLGEALGLALSREYPLWGYPWRVGDPPPAWRKDPDECPDILTHFSPTGILSYRIDEEFVWLERALVRLRREGYRPSTQGRAVGTELRAKGGSTYLLTDGNHRVSALAALGMQRVLLARALRTPVVCEDQVERWPGVRRGRYTVDDALRVFAAYRSGNHSYRTTEQPAPLLAPAAWESLYS